MHSEQAPKTLDSLNLVRLLAALHIVNGHLFERTFMNHGLSSSLTVLLASSASYSTSLFFVLSGLVLAYSRGRRTRSAGVLENPHQTFMRHVQRGFPYFLVGAALMTFATWLRHPTDNLLILKFFKSISFLPPFLFQTPSMNYPAWAMSTFMLGYVIDAYFWQKISSQSTARLLMNTLALVILSSISAAVCYSFLPVTPPYPPRGYNSLETSLHVFPLLRVFEVLFGLLIGTLLYRHYPQIRKALGTRLLTSNVVCFSILLFNVGCLALLCRQSGQLAFAATHGLLLVPMSLFLVGAATNNQWVEELKLTRILTYAGSLSLPVYLLHAPLFSIYLQAFSRPDWKESYTWPFTTGFYVLLLVVASIAMPCVNRVTASYAPSLSNRKRWPVLARSHGITSS